MRSSFIGRSHVEAGTDPVLGAGAQRVSPLCLQRVQRLLGNTDQKVGSGVAMEPVRHVHPSSGSIRSNKLMRTRWQPTQLTGVFAESNCKLHVQVVLL